jgi:hypothetical protein
MELGKILEVDNDDDNSADRISDYRNKWYERTERWENNHITKRV